MAGTMRIAAPSATAAQAGLEAMVGRTIERYRITRKIGAGGMAQVFYAEHDSLGHAAAIKLLDPVLGQDPQASARFFNEARAASLLSHPSIVRIISFGRLSEEEGGLAYMIMEYLEGETLAARFEGLGQRYHPSYVRLVRQIATAMAVVHEHGIVHRDLKMQNVMIVPDPEAPGGERVKIVDFGVAKLKKEHYHPDNTWIQTRHGMLLGTALYMSPEQCAGASELTDRADVYSLGSVFYRLLSGQPLFPDQDVVELIRKQRKVEPIPLARLTPLLPRELHLLVQAMLSKEPAKRPSMQQVANALEPFESPARLPSQVTPPRLVPRNPETAPFVKAAAMDKPPPSLHARWRIHHTAIIVAVLILIFLLLLGTALGAPATTVAVMPFRDLSTPGAASAAGAVGEALRETVTADLKELSDLRVVERSDLDKVLAEQKLQAQRADLDPSTAARVGKLLGATLIVTGAYQRVDKDVRLTARVVRVESGEIVGTAKVDGRAAELLRLQDRVTAQLLRSAGLPHHERRILEKERRRPPLRSLRPVELYGEAVQAQSDEQKRTLLKLAVAEDGGFVYAARDLMALEERLRRYQQSDEAARAQAIAALEQELKQATDPERRRLVMYQLMLKLQEGRRLRQLIALARTLLKEQKGPCRIDPSRLRPPLPLHPAIMPAPGMPPLDACEQAAFQIVIADLRLHDREALLLDGEEFLRRYPGSAYFASAKALLDQALREARDAEEGKTRVAAAVAQVPEDLRWDLCHLARVYQLHHQAREAQRLLRGCLLVGKAPRREVLRELVLSDVRLGDFAQARSDLQALAREDPALYRTVQAMVEFPVDG